MQKLTTLKTIYAFTAVVLFLFSTLSVYFLFAALILGIMYTELEMRDEEQRRLKEATEKRLQVPHVQNDLYEHSNY